MAALLVVAETDGGRILDSTLPTLAFAQTFASQAGGGFDVVFMGGVAIGGAATAWQAFGAERVIVAASPELAHPTADRIAAVCAHLARRAGEVSVAGPA